MKYVYFLWRNLTRKKIRTLLTTLSIFVAFILFGLLSTLKYAFEMGADLSGADRLITLHKVSLIQFLPISYVDRVRQVEGVAGVTHATWFGGYYQDMGNQFPQFPVDADNYFEIYSELKISAEEFRAWKDNRIGAVIGRAVAKRFGWKQGDRVPIISTIFPKKDNNRSWEFVIEGIVDGMEERTDTNFLLFHYAYFDEARLFAHGSIGWMGLKIEHPPQAAEVAKAVDALFANSPAETKTSTEKAFVEAFAKQFGDIGAITTLILTAVFFTMLLVSGNTMAQAVRERIPELAVMKTIGFSNTAVLNLVLAESVLIAFIGGAAGLLLDWLLVQSLESTVNAFLPGFVMTPKTVINGILFIFILGILAGIFPALQAMRLSIVNALGRH